MTADSLRLVDWADICDKLLKLMREISVAYVLAALSAFGFSGIHRFYLGKPITGLLWFFTWGLFGIGTIYDLLTLPSQVDTANLRYLRRIGRVPKELEGYVDQKKLPEALPLETKILRLATRHKGQLNISLVAAKLGISVAESEKELDKLAKSGRASIEVNDDGVIFYRFPELLA